MKVSIIIIIIITLTPDVYCMSQVMDIKDFEIIVVDDASTDNSINILNAFEEMLKLLEIRKISV